jgi:hypothetical protein
VYFLAKKKTVGIISVHSGILVSANEGTFKLAQSIIEVGGRSKETERKRENTLICESWDVLIFKLLTWAVEHSGKLNIGLRDHALYLT